MRSFLIALVGATCIHSMASAQWSAPIDLSASSGDVWGAAIAASGDTVHFTWGFGTINYARSTDEGRSWSTSSYLASADLHLTDSMAADGLDVYVVYLKGLTRYYDWCTGCDREAGDMYLRRSRDGGVTWDSEVRITTGAASYRYSLGVSGARLDLTWMDYRGTAGEIYYI